MNFFICILISYWFSLGIYGVKRQIELLEARDRINVPLVVKAGVFLFVSAMLGPLNILIAHLIFRG